MTNCEKSFGEQDLAMSAFSGMRALNGRSMHKAHTLKLCDRTIDNVFSHSELLK